MYKLHLILFSYFLKSHGELSYSVPFSKSCHANFFIPYALVSSHPPIPISYYMITFQCSEKDCVIPKTFLASFKLRYCKWIIFFSFSHTHPHFFLNINPPTGASFPPIFYRIFHVLKITFHMIPQSMHMDVNEIFLVFLSG